MNFNFDKKTNNLLKIILKNAQKQNIRVFFVGGIVRDNILNIKTHDIDLLVNTNAIDFINTFSDDIKIKSIHKDFATVKVEYKNMQIDIASSRIEKYPYSGCLPVVEKVGVTIDEDVSRRDFSVNSLYAELKLINDEIEYKLIDLVDGLNDIKNKTLKVLHANSYIDDPTRIIRGVGFKYRFGFNFSKEDETLIKSYLKNIDYKNLSYDRCLKVFKYVFNNNFSDEIFNEIVNKKYYKIIQKEDIMLDFTKMQKTLKIFNLSLIEKCEFYINILLNKEVSLINCKTLLEIKNTFSKFNTQDLAYYYCKTNDENILEYLKLKHIELFISGDDLINLGMKQGKKIGIILNKVLSEKLKIPKNFVNKEQELNWIKEKNLLQ